MKSPTLIIARKLLRGGLAALTLCTICATQAVAQSDEAQTGQVRLGRTRTDGTAKKNGGPDQVAADERTPQVKFPRKWNEDKALLRITVENPETTELSIEGVQTSPSLFVVSFPTIILPGASETLVVRYVARAGASGDIDAVRLLTNRGEKVIEVLQDREQAFILGAQRIEWKVKEAITTKTVTLITKQANLRPKALHVLGASKSKAEIRQSAPGQYLVDITPASTETPGNFAIMVEFDPAVPGAASVIQCAITAAN